MTEEQATINDLQVSLMRMTEECNKYRKMANELGSHLNQALTATIWDTKDYAIVARNRWLEEFYSDFKSSVQAVGTQDSKTFAERVDEGVKSVVAMLNEGKANPKDVYPSGRYHGD